MDPLNILQVTIYSKIFNEMATNFSMTTRNIVLFGILYIGIQFVDIDYIKKYIKQLLESSKESSITISQHKQVYYSYSYGLNETIKTIHSNRFDAITHFLIKNNIKNISNIAEILHSINAYDNDNEHNNTNDFIYLPTQHQIILICEKHNIYLEIIIDELNSNDNKNNNTNEPKYKKFNKNYTYKLSCLGRGHAQTIKDFIDILIKEYEKDNDKNITPIYEYIKTDQDEDNKHKSFYREYNFKSNKSLDKNIFFDGRQDFIKYIDQFSKHITPEAKQINESVYEDNGITFKACILLYGETGCGKTSTIRGILNRTGRIGVIIRWSLLKTCAEFRAAFSNNINKKLYALNDLCFIIEDFDANADDVIKSRKEEKEDSKPNLEIFTPTNNISSGYSGTSISSDNDATEEQHKTEITKLKKQIELMTSNTLAMTQNIDKLTLDFILNFLDGIIEHHGGMFIFTTNHIEKIDSAFLRPGRIDYKLKFNKASVANIREMIERKYKHSNIDFTDFSHYFENMKDRIISFADVQQIYLKYDNVEQCLVELVDATNV